MDKAEKLTIFIFPISFYSAKKSFFAEFSFSNSIRFRIFMYFELVFLEPFDGNSLAFLGS